MTKTWKQFSDLVDKGYKKEFKIFEQKIKEELATKSCFRNLRDEEVQFWQKMTVGQVPDKTVENFNEWKCGKLKL